MIQRFQIEDMIRQDATGVVFRAIDLETNSAVTLRRFFPFGVRGGGLREEEQDAYQASVGRLIGLSHPALRSIIHGGCDPVDGIPFIATEWVEGISLKSIIARHPLSAEEAVFLVSQALEVSELLSQGLTDEAVWVETDPRAIIVGEDGSGRRFTFWISPLKWIGADPSNRGMESIIKLTEEIMGWTGQVVGDQAGRGLGGWLKWLRANLSTATLRDARESLASAIVGETPAPVKTVAARTAPLKVRRSAWKAPLFAACALCLMVAATFWYLTHKRALASSPIPAVASAPVPAPVPVSAPAPAPVAPVVQAPPPIEKPATLTPAQRASQRAAELSAGASRISEENEAVLASQKAATDAQGGAILWSHHELLIQNNRNPVILEGVVKDIDKSSSGKTLYLVFSTADRDAARAAIEVGDTPPGDVLGELKPFLGKNVRVTGTVKVQRVAGLNRPDIMMADSSAVTLAE